MPSPIKIHSAGVQVKPDAFHKILRRMAQEKGRSRIAAVSALTNNAGGSAGSVVKVAPFVGAAASGSNLADKTTSEAAFTTVLDALKELYTKANEMANLTGVDQITNNGGGASADGTVGAITVSVTGATTGILVANSNTFLSALNTSVYNLAVLVSKLCYTTGNTPPTITGFDQLTTGTIAAITISGGTAASPGVTKAEADAALAVFRTSIKTLGDLLNTLISTQGILVMAV